jgi:predicted Rossmann fold nucleotide-binding protein DprA/Smf involved in DNA uptake
MTIARRKPPWDVTTYDTESILIQDVTITGTRSTSHREPDEFNRLFADHLGPYSGAHFYVGGARGIDSLALLWLARHTAARFTVVVPGRVDQQPAEAREAIARAHVTDFVELGAAELRSPAFHARNRWMVDRSEMAIGFPLAGPDRTSGTWQTLDYAHAQGKPHLIVPV